jgi:hypothetical protein
MPGQRKLIPNRWQPNQPIPDPRTFHCRVRLLTIQTWLKPRFKALEPTRITRLPIALNPSIAFSNRFIRLKRSINAK